MYLSRKIIIIFINYMNEFLAHSIGLRNSKSQNYIEELFLSIYVINMSQPNVKQSSKASTILQRRSLQTKWWRDQLIRTQNIFIWHVGSYVETQQFKVRSRPIYRDTHYKYPIGVTTETKELKQVFVIVEENITSTYFEISMIITETSSHSYLKPRSSKVT